MKVEFWVIGKTKEAYLREGIALYQKRLQRYLAFNIVLLPDIKQGGKMAPERLMQEEAQSILGRLQSNDKLILLDERGTAFSSVAFSEFVEKELQLTAGKLIFAVGGAYGFAPQLKAKAHHLLSLSKMTFSHQMIRLFFIEQLYRAMTILRNEPYHNG